MKTAVVTVATVLTTLLSVSAGPAQGEKPAFGYGTSCYRPYGGRNMGNISKAVIAVKTYFAHRGMDVKILGHTRRFIRADIYKGGEQVDSIVVDIATGRMRSVY